VREQEEVESFLAQQFENILDLLWCADKNFISAPQGTKKENKQDPAKTNISDKQASSSAENTKNKPRPIEPKTPVYLNEQHFKTQHRVKGDSRQLPKQQVLQKHRLWEKAFKPLKVERKYHNHQVVDIEKTVDFIAQTNIKQLVFKAEKKPLYNLTICVERDKSMEIFYDVLDEFLNSLQHFGVFSKITVLYLHDAKVYRDKALKTRVQNSTSTMLGRDTLTLIVSACLSEAWKTNQMLKLIH